MAKARKPTKKGRPAGRGAPSIERHGVNVVYRDARGRFTKAPKVQPVVPPATQAERLAITGAYAQVTGRRTLYRDPATGRFAKRPEAPVEVVIGKGKRAKVLRPGAEVKPSKVLKFNEADTLTVAATSTARTLEDNAVSGRKSVIRKGGKFYTVPTEQAGGLAQFVRLLNARYLQLFAGKVDSPWLKVGLTEFDDMDLIDLDDLDLATPSEVDRYAGRTEVDEAAAAFFDTLEDMSGAYLKPSKGSNPKKRKKI